MRKTRCLVSAVAVALVAASGAQADRPDDRGGPLGVGAVAPGLGATSAAPDLVERAVARVTDAGSGPSAAAPDLVERAVARAADASSGPSPVRPDDRGGVRPIPISISTPLVAAVAVDGFHWSDAAIGAGFASAVLLLAGAAALTIRQRRRLALS